jgi:hypothetical protein
MTTHPLIRRGFPGTLVTLGAAAFLFWTAPAKASFPPDCPKDMALVNGTCVDKYEGSLVEVKENGTEVPWSAYQAPNGHKVRAVSKGGVAPQAHISMVEAQRACKASGKRLCHAKEWKAACKGPENTRFPYGNEREPNACVDTNRTSPILQKYWGEHTARTLNDPTLNQTPNTVEPTGTAAACTNGYGVHDMVGNVHEWTDDAAFRGGYYLDTTINGEGCDYTTTAHSAIYYDYSTGFRCCADAGSLPDEPEPEAAPPPKPEVPIAPVEATSSEPVRPLGDDNAPPPRSWAAGGALMINGSPRRRRGSRDRAFSLED